MEWNDIPQWVRQILRKYYPVDNDLWHIFYTHSRLVTEKAIAVCDRHPELGLDRDFVVEAAMMHDIGIFATHAPGIQCFGEEPYLKHGRIGAELLRAEGYPRHARVCERHTGAGLTREDIVANDLPLPHENFLPESLEEKVVCYADKFYSKTHLERERSVEKVKKSLERFGHDGVRRFEEWQKIFG